MLKGIFFYICWKALRTGLLRSVQKLIKYDYTILNENTGVANAIKQLHPDGITLNFPRFASKLNYLLHGDFWLNSLKVD
jgi:hypothetical protein